MYFPAEGREVAEGGVQSRTPPRFGRGWVLRGGSGRGGERKPDGLVGGGARCTSGRRGVCRSAESLPFSLSHMCVHTPLTFRGSLLLPGARCFCACWALSPRPGVDVPPSIPREAGWRPTAVRATRPVCGGTPSVQERTAPSPGEAEVRRPWTHRFPATCRALSPLERQGSEV